MKKFIFVTNIMKGNYITLTPEGEECKYSGVSLYLGVSKGETSGEAWSSLSEKHGLKRSLPDLSKVVCFEIIGEHIDINMAKADQIYEQKEEIKLDKPIKTKKPKSKDKSTGRSLDEMIVIARGLGIKEDVIEIYKSRPLGLAKMQLGNLLRKHNERVVENKP